MQEEKPLVSIIIPSYNSDLYIEEAIISALNQTYSNKEVIVIDDGSIDNTQEILKKYKDRIKILTQENQGVAKARNTGIKHSNGEYVANLDADDKWYIDRLEKMIPFMISNNLDIITSNYIYVDESRMVINNKPAFFENYTAPNPSKQYHSLLREATAFTFMIVKREILNEIDGYDDNLNGEAEDYDLWLRLLQKGAVWGYFPYVTAEYMVRRGGLSKKYSKNRKKALKSIFMKHSPYIGKYKALRLYRYHLGSYYFDILLITLKCKDYKRTFISLIRLFKTPLFILRIPWIIMKKMAN